ncbi:TraQ conjugal transfer family protein [Soonwooa purpurea]
MIIPVLLLIEYSLSSCTNHELGIEQNFPFEVSVMPIPSGIANGQTVEIRIKILPQGKYKENKYYLRYFQFEGKGSLKYYNDQPYLPNDLYEIPQNDFRLYYTSQSDESESFDVWILCGIPHKIHYVV